eukprot:105441-Rhodomonas_salina.1
MRSQRWASTHASREARIHSLCVLPLALSVQAAPHPAPPQARQAPIMAGLRRREGGEGHEE